MVPKCLFTKNPPRIPPIRVYPTTVTAAESPSTSASLGSHSSQPLLILPRACISSVGLEPRACAREAPAQPAACLVHDRLCTSCSLITPDKTFHFTNKETQLAKAFKCAIRDDCCKKEKEIDIAIDVAFRTIVDQSKNWPPLSEG